MAKWWILIKERFSPASYVPMILLFTWANGLYLTKSMQQDWNWSRFAVVFVLLLSFFFRMRLFDEIKDYEVDLKVNPTRPLARGVLSVSQVKKALLVLIILELVIAGSLGLSPFLVHAIAIGYSLMMYEEFFIGDLLRPHLTTYAVSHTFVSALLGLSAGIAMTGMDLTQLKTEHGLFFLMNWAFFNLFEFARKTFAPEEERDHVPSYSNIFGCTGAWVLSISQAVLGVALIYFLHPNLWPPIALTVYVAVSLAYLLRKSRKTAAFFRNISGVYLLVHYIILICILGV